MKRLVVPLLVDDSSEPGIIEPDRKAKSRLGGRLRARLPSRVVLCFLPDVAVLLEQFGAAKTFAYHAACPILILQYRGVRVAVVSAPAGSYGAVLFEELIALGGREFVMLGGAGRIIPGTLRGSFLLPSSAIRDEGVSYHYLRPGFSVRPCAALVARLRRVLRRDDASWREGASWTTDALYRETAKRRAVARQAGALCVEMEAASFFAIAAYRRVCLAALFWAGDDVSGTRWRDPPTPRTMARNSAVRSVALRYALEALCDE